MKEISKIKLTYLFDKYPIFYQPYIDLLIEELSKKKEIELAIKAFETGRIRKKNVTIFPSYKKRKVYEKILHFIGKNKGLSYPEYQLMKGDIVHLQHSYLFPKLLRMLKRPENKRPKIVITLRGGDTYVKPWVSKKWRNFYKNQGELVDAFVVMSKHQKMYLHQKWGVSDSKIHVIPISFGAAFKAEPKLPNKNVLKIASVFRLCWEKNIDGNLQVIKHLKKTGIPVQYDIYGGGPQKGQLFYLADKYGLTHELNYKGEVSNDLLKEQLNTYDFILQLSLSEALPTSVLEAQAMGVPAVVSDNGGLPEAVKDGKTGIVMAAYKTKAIAEKMKTLWRNNEDYLQFSKQSIEEVQKKFNTAQEVEKLSELYRVLRTIK